MEYVAMPFYEHNSENILFYKPIHTTLEYKATKLKCFSMQNLKKNEKKISAQDSIQFSKGKLKWKCDKIIAIYFLS